MSARWCQASPLTETSSPRGQKSSRASPRHGMSADDAADVMPVFGSFEANLKQIMIGIRKRNGSR